LGDQLEEVSNKPGDETPSTVAVEVNPQPPASPAISQPITAGPGMYYRNTRYIMAALTVIMGFWFGYDGFVRWPAENQTIAKIEAAKEAAEKSGDDATATRLKTELKDHSSHTDTDLLLQRILAFSLPPLGIALLLWALYNSRGQYRLADDTLFIPGHPPVSLASIRELDQSLWDRKGIARVAYQLSDGKSGKAKLDDFVYDRTPTDQIYDQIKKHLQPPAEGVVVTTPQTEPVVEKTDPA
jgi:hypothetical protein